MGESLDGVVAAHKRLAGDEDLRKRLFLYAYRLVGKNIDRARDLRQQAIVRALDPAGSPWNPESQPDLFRHLGSIMNSLVANGRRAEARHPSEGYDTEGDPVVDAAPSAEQRLSDAEDEARLQGWLTELRRRLAGDAIALGRIDLVAEGVDDYAQQAARLGCEVKDVYRAQERIKYHAGLVKRAAGAGSPDARSRPGTGPRVAQPTAPDGEPGAES